MRLTIPLCSKLAEQGTARCDFGALKDWLLSEGRLIEQPEQFVAEVGQRLLGLGVPLMRMRVGLRTLNPQAIGKSYTWWRDRPEVEVFDPPFSIMDSSDYIGSPVEAVQTSGLPFRCRLDGVELGQLHNSLQTLRANGATDYLALPLEFSNGSKANTWMLTTDHPDGLSDHDVEGLCSIVQVLALVLEVSALKMTATTLLDTYLGPRSGRRVFEGQVKRGDAELIETVVWYCDMRDSTAITESLPLEQVLRLLNQYFEIINTAVTEQGGEVLRFVGDAMLAIFPVEGERSLKQACEAAIVAADLAREAMAQLNVQLQQEALPCLRYGVGLDIGSVVYGNVGAPDRLDFTVMGTVVNRAARIESLTKETGCSLLVSEAFVGQLTVPCQFQGGFDVAGVSLPLNVYSMASADR